jgi:hypothetical protein
VQVLNRVLSAAGAYRASVKKSHYHLTSYQNTCGSDSLLR